MGYASLRATVEDLQRKGDLRVVDVEIDPRLEMGEIQRRVQAARGPALLFTRAKGTAFPMLANLFGTIERARFLFRDALEGVRSLVDAKVDPSTLIRNPLRALSLPSAAAHLIPIPVRSGAVLAHSTTISSLPQLVSWPDDGGPFVTLPQVFTEDPDRPGLRHSNLGMYRIQLSGNDYARDREIGLHYQIHRGIGVHHAAAIRRKERLPVKIFVGGPPSMTVAAVMPLPEGLPEISFAGALNKRAIRMVGSIHADADFVISGYVDPHETKPEGPFGDHLGYYARVHDFPVMHVESVHHREGAIWPFTTVGRPPQEDSVFGALIHELTSALIPTVLPGVHDVHAVDESGVHPLLLATGSERYTPYASGRQRPMEVLTQANAILGQGQLSLAKYLFIAAKGDSPPPAHEVGPFLRHVLERVDPMRDLHFHVHTTMDTLDYSGTGLNQGSKVVIAGVGEKIRELGRDPNVKLPDGFADPKVVMPGVLAVRAPRHSVAGAVDADRFCRFHRPGDSIERFPLVVLCDDAELTARTLANFLWVTFTRSNPATDIYGIGAVIEHKAWGCRGPIVIDARTKAHHAPPLIQEPAIERRVEALAARGGPLYGLY